MVGLARVTEPVLRVPLLVAEQRGVFKPVATSLIICCLAASFCAARVFIEDTIWSTTFFFIVASLVIEGMERVAAWKMEYWWWDRFDWQRGRSGRRAQYKWKISS